MGFSSDMRTIAPSRRVGGLVIVILAIIVAVVVFQGGSDVSSSPEIVLSDEQSERVLVLEVDTDGDGLKDWEEELWGLNPTSPDSDGDGVGDAQEVAEQQREAAEVPSTILGIYEESSGEKPSSLALAGQVLISQFFASKQVGAPVPDNSIRLASNIALNDINTDRTYVSYTQADVTVINKNDQTTLRAYGNDIGRALAHPNGEAPHELFVLVTYAQTADGETFISQMNEVLANYDRVINGFLAMQVPSNSAPIHVALINALVAVRTDLSDITSIVESPVDGLVALGAYEQNSTVMAQLFQRVRDVFDNAGIEFAVGEPGYTFMHAADN